MTCIWNGNLHRWKVDRSNKHHQKQFLNLDHWIQYPKSREHDEHTWFVVRLRHPLRKGEIYNWRTIATWSHDQNMCTSRLTLKEQKIFQLWRNAHTEGTCYCIKGYVPTAWINQLISIKHKLELFHTNAFSYPYILRNSESSIIQWFYLSRSQYHGCLTMLAFYTWIFHMECNSCSITVQDGRPWTIHPY